MARVEGEGPLGPGEEFLDRVLELPREQREAFLRSKCADDPELLERLLALVRTKPSGFALKGATGILAPFIGRAPFRA